jgi:hypothetical protein
VPQRVTAGGGLGYLLAWRDLDRKSSEIDVPLKGVLWEGSEGALATCSGVFSLGIYFS